MKFDVCYEYLKFINQFINNSMFITCLSDIENMKIQLKKCIMYNQAKNWELEKIGRGYHKRGKKKVPKES